MAALSMIFDIFARDNASGTFRNVGDEADRTGQRLTSFGDQATKASATMRAAIGGPGGIALAATAAAGALSPLVGAVALLPGAALAGGAAMGTLAVGTRGFGDALSNLGDTEKFNEAIAKLSPNASAAAVAVRELGPAFSGLQIGVQNALFAGFATQITAIGTQFAPVLRTGMTGVATALNAAGMGVAGFLRESATVTATQTIFESTRVTIQNLAAGVQPLLQAFRDIGVVGAEMLPGLTAGFGAATTSFAEFIARARESGAIREFIQSGIDAFRDLGTVILAVVEGITGTIGPFSLASGALSLLADNSGLVTAAIQVLLPLFLAYRAALVVAAVAQGIQAGALLAYNVIARTAAVGQALLNAALAANPIGLVIAVIVALVAVLVLAYRNSETFRTVVQAAFVAVKLAVEQLKQAFTVAMAAIVAVFNGGGGQIGSIIRGVVGVVRSQFDAFMQIARGAINVVVGLFTGDFGKVKTGAQQVLGGLVSYFTTIPGLLLRALGNLGSLLVGAGGDLLRGLTNGIRGAIGAAVDAAVSAAKAVVSGIKGALGISSPSKVTMQLGKFTAQGFALGISSGAGDVSSAFTDLTAGIGSSSLDLTGVGDNGLGGKLDRIEAAILDDARRRQVTDRQMAGV